MKTEGKDHWIRFVAYTTAAHCITYALFGVIASSVFNYSDLFTKPILCDYYKPFGSVAIYLGPFFQVVRGVLFGLVLVPFRELLKEENLGWLWLWALFIVIGIVGTPAASPSSIEGLIYTKMPIWFHLIGMPEMLGQTLLFSFLIHKKLHKKGNSLSPKAAFYLKSLVSTGISFLGYSIISVLFAVASGNKVDTSAVSAAVLGQFVLPMLLIFVFSLASKMNTILKNIVLYILSALSIWLYQGIILGSSSLPYSLVAPILPIFISYLSGKIIGKTTA